MRSNQPKVIAVITNKFYDNRIANKLGVYSKLLSRFSILLKIIGII
jgi:hypothetical protein